jgi:Xaa-Pro dipeptidase
MTTHHIDTLAQLMQPTRLDAIVLNPGPGLLGLTGLQFHLMERPTLFLVGRDGRATMILSALEEMKARDTLPGLTCYTYSDNPATWAEAIRDAFSAFNANIRVMGVESARMRHLELAFIQNALPGVEVLSADPQLSALRIHKDAQAIGQMRQAVQIAERAFSETLHSIRPGMSERAVAGELAANMLRFGSDAELPFPPIVAAGPNSANPHAVPSERVLQTGDLVVIDWGAAFGGYFSDLTRTLAIGKLDAELYTIYDAVKGANRAGREAGRPGVTCGTVDAAGRAVITSAGYGPYFTHRIGHGLGLEAHEEPYMFGESTQMLEEGMVYTVEPGIYLPGKGGVRIEDDMAVTETGAVSLSGLPRELITIPA